MSAGSRQFFWANASVQLRMQLARATGDAERFHKALQAVINERHVLRQERATALQQVSVLEKDARIKLQQVSYVITKPAQ